MPVITVPKFLREKLSDEGVDALVEIINKADDKMREDVISLVEQKFERRLAEVESRIIRWMFVFILGQFWAIVATLFVFFKR